eukprot:gnl/TRDRNA2_/TRDRNA2_159618_c0_seq2.p1 gnl/TRDRNA2_/TRDRNA2_159618_c0~~gnl/TRDRNA2_/TRDRNA2_159618_c0_seq2.p1  ORF type:complete len:608 (+),score=123.88 gnl/TRDRNA2_/TRDRNA2_159618_c0_seq2:231-1826(+)
MLPVDEDGVERFVREEFDPDGGGTISQADMEAKVLPYLEDNAADLVSSTPQARAPPLTKASSRAELLAWFKHWDADGSGTLDSSELCYAVATLFFQALGDTDPGTKQAVVQAFLAELGLDKDGQVAKTRFLEQLAPVLQANLPVEAAEAAGRDAANTGAGGEARLRLLHATTGASAAVVLPAGATLGQLRHAAIEQLEPHAAAGTTAEVVVAGRRLSEGDEVSLASAAPQLLRDGAVAQVLTRPPLGEAERMRRMRDEVAEERERLRREREELQRERERLRHEARPPQPDRLLVRGTRVTVQGIIASPELNGRSATVQHYDEQSGRYVVEVDGIGTKSLRPEALVPHVFAGSSGGGAAQGPGLLQAAKDAARKACLRLQVWAADYEWWQLLVGAGVVLLVAVLLFRTPIPNGQGHGRGRAEDHYSDDRARPDHGRYRHDDVYDDYDDYDDGLLGGLDQNTLLLLAAGFGFLCWKGVIPVQNLDFWQGLMLWNMLQPLLFGNGGRRRGAGMGSFGPGHGGLGSFMWGRPHFL